MIRRLLGDLWWVERNVRLRMRVSRYCALRVPGIGRLIAALVDRSLLSAYGLDVNSARVDVAQLTMGHPDGILLGGNGLVSPGRVAIMTGAKFVGRSPTDPDYLARHRTGDVFRLGDNVVIGANSVVVGPVTICDNVVVAPLSLVNKSITEPGLYGGIPAKLLRAGVPGDEWVAHLPRPGSA